MRRMRGVTAIRETLPHRAALRRRPTGREAPGLALAARGEAALAMPTEYLGDQLVHWIEEGDAPILYLHGVPNGAVMWKPFLERTGGVAVDLPGFGESGKRGDLD